MYKMCVKRLQAMVCIVALVVFTSANNMNVRAEIVKDKGLSAEKHKDKEFSEFANNDIIKDMKKKYPDGPQKVESFENSILYETLEEQGNKEEIEYYESLAKNDSEIKEMYCYIELIDTGEAVSEYNVFSEQEFIEYIDENGIELDC